jgi:hypothetical protein
MDAAHARHVRIRDDTLTAHCWAAFCVDTLNADDLRVAIMGFPGMAEFEFAALRPYYCLVRVRDPFAFPFLNHSIGFARLIQVKSL